MFFLTFVLTVLFLQLHLLNPQDRDRRREDDRLRRKDGRERSPDARLRRDHPRDGSGRRRDRPPLGELDSRSRRRDMSAERDRRSGRKRSRSRDPAGDQGGGGGNGATSTGGASKRRNRRLARDSSSEESDEDEIKDGEDLDEDEDLDEEALIERRRRQRQELVARLEGGKTSDSGTDRDNRDKVRSLGDSQLKVEPPEAALSISASSPATSTQDGVRSHERARSISPQPVILDSDGDTTFSKVRQK